MHLYHRCSLLLQDQDQLLHHLLFHPCNLLLQLLCNLLLRHLRQFVVLIKSCTTINASVTTNSAVAITGMDPRAYIAHLKNTGKTINAKVTRIFAVRGIGMDTLAWPAVLNKIGSTTSA